MNFQDYLIKKRSELNFDNSSLKVDKSIGVLLKKKYGENFLPPGLLKKSIEIEAVSLEKSI